jgi:hypothetical protein
MLTFWFLHRRLSQSAPSVPQQQQQPTAPCSPCGTTAPSLGMLSMLLLSHSRALLCDRMLPPLAQASQSVSQICASAAASASSTLQPLRDHHAITPNVLAALHTRERQLLTVMTLQQDLEDKRAKLSAAQLMPASQAKRVGAEGRFSRGHWGVVRVGGGPQRGGCMRVGPAMGRG